MERYLADEYHLGIGQERDWVYQHELTHRLAMHFGRRVSINEIVSQGEWHEVFDLVELFLRVADDIAWNRYRQILAEVAQAFEVSGSVYYITSEGQIALHIESETTERIDQAVKNLGTLDKAREVLQGAAAGLASRRMEPQDVVRDTYVAFEEFLKEKTGQKDLPESVKALRSKGILTATQGQIIEKLYGFRSEVFGVTHAGKARVPTESDALWLLDSVSAQILFLDRVLKKNDDSGRTAQSGR